MKIQSGKVQTVLGLMDPGDLGHTQTHEHLLVNLIPYDMRDVPMEPFALENMGRIRRHWHEYPFNLCLTEEDVACQSMEAFKLAGGKTIVDVTNLGIDRDPSALVRISEATGVNIVMGSSYYEGPYHPAEVAGLSHEEIAEWIRRDVQEGVDGSKIKAGIIGEIGLGWPIRDEEIKVLKASAAAQKATGAALSIHPGRGTEAPFAAMDIIIKAGGDAERTIMCHIDRTLFTLKDMLALAETGCCLEFDLFGHESSFYPLSAIDMPNDAQRIDHLTRLIEAGFKDKLLISQDICTKIHLAKYGGEGYTHILENVIPMMEMKGLSAGDIKALTHDNPARALTFV